MNEDLYRAGSGHGRLGKKISSRILKKQQTMALEKLSADEREMFDVFNSV